RGVNVKKCIRLIPADDGLILRLDLDGGRNPGRDGDPGDGARRYAYKIADNNKIIAGIGGTYRTEIEQIVKRIDGGPSDGLSIMEPVKVQRQRPSRTDGDITLVRRTRNDSLPHRWGG